MEKEEVALGQKIDRITFALLLFLLTHSAAPSSVLETWVEKHCSGSTLSEPQMLVLGAVEGLTSVAHSQSSLKIPIYIKGKEIQVEVAKTPEERTHGLMGRKHLGKDEGMLFVFEREDYHGFWMKDTQISLSIAFVDKGGQIIGIEDMKPLTLETHTPSQPILYALEMKKGWFSANGIKVGDIVRFSK
jgi:uncharacterized membrane protein (UPF0127 family)